MESTAATNRINKMTRYQSAKISKIGQLTAGIAHELLNPLALIRVKADLIEMQSSSLPDEFRQHLGSHLQAIQNNISKMSEIINQVCRLSRKSEDLFQQIDIHEICKEVAHRSHPSIDSGKIKLVIEAKARNPKFFGDRANILEALTNLINNACQAILNSGKGETIHLRTASKEQWIEIEVEDDGPGIPPNDLSSIFNPFFSTKRPGEGVGLGLSIVAEIIVGHGGWIDVDSEAGSGTRFKLSFPHDRRGMLQDGKVDSLRR